MKPRVFDYMRPNSVAEALDLLARHGEEARILAGGQSLIAMLNLRLVETGLLIDISRLAELGHIGMVNGALEVGAAVTQNTLLAWPELKVHVPLLAKAMPFVGHFQTRNRGTVCGSVAHADPSSEIPLALAMLDGEVVLQSKHGKRTLKAAAFQLGMLSTARRDDEMIVALRFPVNRNARAAFREVARRAGDFAIVAVGALATRPDAVTLGIGGAGDKPFVREIAFQSAGDLTERIEALVWQLDAHEDIHAGARMRRDLVRRLAPLVVGEAMP